MNTIPTSYTHWMFNVLQSNSLIEWSFRKAITIRTFSNYHPIPVPLNLLSQLGMLLIQCIKFCRRRYGSRNCCSQIPDSEKTSGEDQAYEEKVWWGLHRVKVSFRRPEANSALSRFKRVGVYTIRLEKMLVNRQIACHVLDGTNSNSSRIYRFWTLLVFPIKKKQTLVSNPRVVPRGLSPVAYQRSEFNEG